jgi:hypothetical protein
MFHHTVVGVSDYSRKADLIDQLMIGIEDKHAVFITYQSLQGSFRADGGPVGDGIEMAR